MVTHKTKLHKTKYKGWSLIRPSYIRPNTRGGHSYTTIRNTYGCDWVTPYFVEMGVAHHVAPYTTEKSQSHCGFLPQSQSHSGILPKSQGHGGFSGEVIQSQPNLGGHKL